MNRRGFLIGALFAPAVVKAEFLMPVKAVIWEPPVLYKNTADMWGWLWDYRKNGGAWERKRVGYDFDRSKYAKLSLAHGRPSAMDPIDLCRYFATPKEWEPVYGVKGWRIALEGYGR